MNEREGYEQVTFEDGSVLRGTDACVTDVRDAETGQWTHATPGYMYADADGNPWIGCPDQEAGVLVNNDGSVPFLMPDTAYAPEGGVFGSGLGGAVVVLVLAMAWLAERTRR